MASCVLRLSIMERKTTGSFHIWANIIVAVTDFNIFFKDGKDYETTRFS